MPMRAPAAFASGIAMAVPLRNVFVIHCGLQTPVGAMVRPTHARKRSQRRAASQVPPSVTLVTGGASAIDICSSALMVAAPTPETAETAASVTYGRLPTIGAAPATG